MTEITQEYKCEACHDSGYICGEYCVFCEKDRAKQRRKREKRLQQDLKPCPLCMGDVKVNYTSPIFMLKCTSCGGHFSLSSNLLKALEMWNTRAYEAEIQALKIQLGKCIIQENETLAIAVAHGWEYATANYTDEKAMKAYREWKERP